MRGNKMNDKPGTLCCWRRAFAGASYDYREILSRRNDLKLEDVVDLFSETVESGKVEEGWHLFCSLSLEGVKPDVIIYNTMISGICRKGLKEEADALFRKMKEDGPLPDSGTYNTLIRVRLRDSDRAASAELIEEMRSRGFAGDASTIGLVTNMLHDGRLDKSFLEMLS